MESVSLPGRPTWIRDPLFWAELTAAGGVGALLFFVMGLKDLGQVAWIIGGLHVYHRYVLAHNFRQELSVVAKALDESQSETRRIGDLIDITATCDITQLRSAVDKYSKIVEPELAWQKNEALTTLVDSLDELLRTKRSRTMQTHLYYNWLLPKLAATSRGNSIWAVSRMLDCEWDASPEEEEFLKENLNAAKRGVIIQRIFLCTRQVWDSARSSSLPIQAQISCGDTLEVYFGDTDAIQSRDSSILNEIGDGMIAFDRDVILLDEHSHDGSARGHLVMDRTAIAKKRQAFDGLRNLCARQVDLK